MLASVTGELSVVPATKSADNVQAELETAKNQMAEMQKQMQAMMAQMQAMMADAQTVAPDNSVEKTTVKRGRKKAEAKKAEVVPAE